MLTNLYYYDHYRPYILRTKPVILPGPISVAYAQKSAEAEKNKAFLLNSAYKSDVIQYVRDMSNTVNSLKCSIMELLKSARSGMFSTENDAFGLKNYFISDLKNFVNSANEALSFTKSQNNSQELANFSQTVTDIIINNREVFQQLCISVEENGSIALSSEDAAKKKLKDLFTGLIGASGALIEIHDKTKELMANPLTDHMKFKSLGYYYNYKYGSIKDNTFNIIDSGMLFDKEI